MLRIGKLTDYAILIMAHLAKTPECIMSATVLSRALFLSTPTVSKILKILSDADLLVATRGAEGGYKLSTQPANISVLSILEAMEGSVSVMRCCEKAHACTMEAHCATKENWKKINLLIHRLLKGVTLHDMLNPLNTNHLLLGLSHGE